MAHRLDQFTYLNEPHGSDDRPESMLLQFHCTPQLAEELREICRYNFMDQTQVVVIALKLYLEHLRCMRKEADDAWEIEDESILEAAEDSMEDDWGY